MFSIFLGLGLLATLLATHELSIRAGRRAHLLEPNRKPEFGPVSGAMLGLLGLLLAFSFSNASDHFGARQNLIVEEANALGTAWLRTDVLPEAPRSALRRQLIAYTDVRLALGRADSVQAIHDAEKASSALHASLWAAGLAATDTTPERALLILPVLNDIIDLHTTRATAMRRHHRGPVLFMLGFATLFATALIGYSAGLTGYRQPLFQAAFAVLASGVLWLTIDFDFARVGFIRTEQSALISTRAGMSLTGK